MGPSVTNDLKQLFGRSFLALMAICILVAPQYAHAQYPEKPIRLIVPFVAGGTPDFIARLVQADLSGWLGHRVIVDNRPGAGGLVGTEAAAKAAPDGYTLLLGGTSAFCVTPALQARNKRYDAVDDFAHIALLAEAQLLVVSHPSVPATGIKALIELAKRQPGKLSYASSGNGTSPHILGELFKHATGLRIQHVPYKGGPQAWTAVTSGEVELLVGQVQQAIPQLASGRLRAHAVFGNRRSRALPAIPTFQEADISGLEVSVWYSLAAPAKTPVPIVDQLNKAVNGVLSAPEIKTKIYSAGFNDYSMTPEESARFVKAEMPRWAKAVRISGAQID